MIMFAAISQYVPKNKNNTICNFCSIHKCIQKRKSKERITTQKQNRKEIVFVEAQKIVPITKITKFVICIQQQTENNSTTSHIQKLQIL